MIDALKLVLFPSELPFLTIFIIIGFCSPKRIEFSRALFILLFSIILNSFLKSIWQIPLAEHLNKIGYAFPSGHMQTATAFWGWLAWELQNSWFYILVLFILTGIAFGLMHFGYHDSTDVQGGIVFAILSLVVYSLICQKLKNKNPALIGSLLIALGFLLIFLIPQLSTHTKHALEILIGFSILIFFIGKKHDK